jgi:hypothetical protein
VHDHLIRAQDGLKMRRTNLFFILPSEAKVRMQRNMGGVKGVEGRELRDYGSPIVGCRARMDPFVAIDLTQKRGERRAAFPLRGCHRLAIVMCTSFSAASRSSRNSTDFHIGRSWRLRSKTEAISIACKARSC